MHRLSSGYFVAVVGVAACVCVAGAARAYDQPYRVIEGGQWNLEAGPIPYHLEPSGSDDVDDGSDLQALRDAFRAWTCVKGTAIRFAEQPEPGTKVADLGDNFNTLFWDETNEFGLGPAVLGVNIGTAAGTRTNADIIFNGFDTNNWSTGDGQNGLAVGTDVGSIALHEIGHFLGLDHPCGRTPNGDETDCNTAAGQSVMSPVWSGNVERYPFSDDEKGVVFLYPAEDPDATCDGPRRRGETCACDDECDDGLACVPGVDGITVCATTCDAENSDCGFGFGCVLGPPEGNEVAPGACVKAQSGAFPPGTVCNANSNCEVGSCSLVRTVARSVCRLDCENDDECGELGTCIDGACLIKTLENACPVKGDNNGCACNSATSLPQNGVRSSPLFALLALWIPLCVRTRGSRRVRRG